jgi:hypothetical protein
MNIGISASRRPYPICETVFSLNLLSACRIGNLAGIIDCGIFMNRLFAVHKFGAFKLFPSVVVGRNARAIFAVYNFRLIRLSLRAGLCYEMPGDSTLAPWLDGGNLPAFMYPHSSVRG